MSTRLAHSPHLFSVWRGLCCVALLLLTGCVRSRIVGDGAVDAGAVDLGGGDLAALVDGAAIDGPIVPVCVPEPEICNGRDDDCDDVVDNEPAASTWCGARCGVEMCPRARPIAPMSNSLLTTRRPAFRWALEGDADSATLEVCRDRACTAIVTRLEGTTSATPLADLPRGVLFWRLVPRRGGRALPAVSPPWVAHLPNVSHDVDTSTGTVLDLDADGRGDVVFKTFHGAEIYLGSPIGLVAAYRFDRISDGIEKLGDVDGDGHDDLGNYTGVPSQLFRGAPGGLAPPIPLERIGDGTGDVNGDGYADLLVFDGIVYGSPAGPRGAPTFNLPTEWWWIERGDAFPAGDLDADGIADIAAYIPCSESLGCPANTHVWVFPGSISGLLPGVDWGPEPPVMSISGSRVTNLLLGDIDGDGRMDLAVNANWVGERRSPRPPRSWGVLPSRRPPSSDTPWVRLGELQLVGPACDIDGDGIGDLLTSDGARVLLSRGGPAGLESAIDVLLGLTPFASTCLGDDDGDGLSDVAVHARDPAAAGGEGADVLLVLRGKPRGTVPPLELVQRLEVASTELPARYGSSGTPSLQ